MIKFLRKQAVVLGALAFGLAGCTERTELAPAPLVPQWSGLSKPEDTVKAYIEALKANDLDRAIAYLYLPPDKDLEVLRGDYQEVSLKVRQEDWQVGVIHVGQINRFASVIYTTKKDLSDPEPILAAQDPEGRWRLYHMATAGRMDRLFKGRDLNDANTVVQKGKEKMAEIRGLMRRKAEQNAKP